MKKTIISLAAAIVILPTLAIASHCDSFSDNINYTGPIDLRSISSLLSQDRHVKDQDVIVEGYLIRQISEDSFLFSDGKAQILLELDDDIHLSEALSDSSKIRVFAEFEAGKEPKLEAERLLLI